MIEYEDMVVIVENWFDKETATNQQRFLDTPKEKLVKYHDTLGRTIRNEFKLWETNWTPEIKNGVDYSPFHPDQISMSIIEDVWTNMKTKQLENS